MGASDAALVLNGTAITRLISTSTSSRSNGIVSAPEVRAGGPLTTLCSWSASVDLALSGRWRSAAMSSSGR